MTKSFEPQDPDDEAVGTTDGDVSSVTAEWALSGAAAEEPISGIEGLVGPLPLSALLDEFSMASLIRRERLVRHIDWPTTTGSSVGLDAHFSIAFDADGEPARILMSALGTGRLDSGAGRGHALSALHERVADIAASVSDEAVGSESPERREAARSVAAAMIALAGDIRQLSDFLQSARPSPTSSADGEAQGDRRLAPESPPTTRGEG